MSFGHIKLSLRPIKLAFLVDPYDTEDVRKAIEINSFLWGGVYNPIIPAYKRKPKNWEPHPSTRLKVKDIITGYIKGYDPDFIVPIGKISKYKLEIPNRNLIKSEDILSTIEKELIPCYGVGIFESLKYIYDTEFKFIRKNPIQIVFPNVSGQYRLFLESFFGVQSTSIDKITIANYDKALEITRPDVNLQTFYKYLPQEYIFPRRITTWNIKVLRQRTYRGDKCVFLFDATKSLDVIDYWNLRAIGWDVLPAPKQLFADENFRKIIENFIEENYFPDRNYPNIYHETTVQQSRSISTEEAKTYTKSLQLNPTADEHNSKYSLYWWYPRIWDNWAREKDGVDCCTLEVNSRQYDFDQTPNGDISLQTVAPPMIFPHVFSGTPRYANDISLRFYGDKEPLAEVIPEGDEHFVSRLGFLGFDEWRIGSQGFVYLSNHSNWSFKFKIPLAEKVFASWLDLQKWKISPSPAGRIAKQMLKQVEGIWGISFLTKPALIDLLEQIAEGKTLSEHEFRGAINKIIRSAGLNWDAKAFIQKLTELDVIKLGIEIQCPTCQQHSWHSLTSLDYKIKCEKCLDEFFIPTHAPVNDLKWSYRGYGPFSLPKSAYGVYSVLLTLRFFSQILDGAITPITSFCGTGPNGKFETDLGMFYQDSKFGMQNRELIFAECKTHNTFKSEDIAKIDMLAKSFPGAVIVLATLNAQLSKQEIKLIKPIANRGRKYWKDNRSFNPVLVLTETELYADHLGIAKAWNKKGGRHREFANNRHFLRDLLPLCDITQQLYLNMPSFHEWHKKKRERKRVKREKRGK